MPKVKILQTNFSSGEISTRATGRTDIARFPNAAKRLVNVIPRTLGGAEKRPGSEYITATKHADKRSRLIPFIYSRDQSYMLEMGENYLRVFKPDGSQVGGFATPYEITTPYNAAAAAELDYCQSEDAMYLFHGDVYPNRLRSFGDAAFDCSPAPFTTTPFTEQGHYFSVALTLSANTVGTGRTMTAASGVFLAADVGRAILWKSGIAVITGYTSATVVAVEVKVIFDSTAIPSGQWNLDSSPQAILTPSAKDPVGASVTLTLAANGWRTEDVGKFVRLNSGLVKITAFTSALIVTATIITELTATVAVPALAWTLESSVWNALNGYPRTGTLHEQRLIAASSDANPQTVWGSRTGEPLDFTNGVNDDDSFSFTIGSDEATQITFISSARNLLVFSYNGEYSMQSGVEKPITPTNVQIKQQTPHGAGLVRPVQVGKETVFVQRAGRKLRAMGYKYDEDGYKSPDITTLAEHITETGVASMALQQEPDPVMWVALNNGRLVSVTLDRDLDVIAWSQHEIDGAVESVATMPAGDTEQVWMIIRRLVDGNIVRYVERLRSDWYPIYGTASPDPDDYPPADEPFSWGFQLDCALTQDDATGKTTWTGFDHLEGRVVRCIADGIDMSDFTVTGGAITLLRPAKRVLVGLMFSPSVELLTTDIQGATGSSLADAISVNEIGVHLYNTGGATINGSLVVPGRYIGEVQLDSAPDLFSGKKFESAYGWDKGEAVAVISQDSPFPFHLLAVIRTITINGG